MTSAVPVPAVPERAIWCAAPHGLDPLILCARPIGHSGLHRSDNADDWADEPTPNEENTSA